LALANESSDERMDAENNAIILPSIYSEKKLV
jgi:hypothetical protein